MIDTHAHLESEQYDQDREEVIQRAREAGISRIINVGSSLEGSRKGVEISNTYSDIYNAVGLHPHEAGKDLNLEIVSRELKGIISDKTVAIGEIGLDYFQLADLELKEKQKDLFISQLALAQELGKPVILHCREAYEEMFAIMERHKIDKGVVHCFSGSQKEAERFLKMGFYLSFTGILTYPKADMVREVAKKAPIERIMLETDCPLLPPQSQRGERNEPAYLLEIAEKLAVIRGKSLEEIGIITDKNAKEFFAI